MENYDWMDSEQDVWRFNPHTRWWDCVTGARRTLTRARIETLEEVDRLYGPLVPMDERPESTLDFGLKPEVAQGLGLADQLWEIMVTLNSMDGRWAYGQLHEPWGGTAHALKTVLIALTGATDKGVELYERCLGAHEKPSLHFAAVVA